VRRRLVDDQHPVADDVHGVLQLPARGQLGDEHRLQPESVDRRPDERRVQAEQA
jgi:hypothetical protein